MKTILSLVRNPSKRLTLTALALGLAGGALAQVGTLMPVVSIRATDPGATWAGDPGTFTVYRAGPTNMTLNVFCQIGGTAQNGVDYETISQYLLIPAGVRTGAVSVTPIDLGQTVSKTVELQLAMPPTLGPINYEIGVPSNAVVVIYSVPPPDIPPVVAIATPSAGTQFPGGADIPICAGARDPDGYVSTVEFFENGVSLGVRTNNPMAAGPANPFCLVWSNVPPGDYALTALATDNGGAATLSGPVDINVGPPPPPTNYPPAVRITSPAYGAVFRAPIDIPLVALARDPDDAVAAVEFFADGTSLGLGKPAPPWVAPPVGPTAGVIWPSNLFVLVWSNAPVGGHVLTATATDTGGASATSPPVQIGVLSPVPPPTNRPPVVSIVATDPVAVEGTNCWVWPVPASGVPTWSNWPVATTACRFVTNCGPKNATLMVRRFGDTNAALTVPYAIGGTATNGVDYVPLPGSVTIPAGERAALITVVPLDDGPPDITSTVVLKLMPSPAVPPDYVVGFPARAAVIIIDRGPLPPPMGLLPCNCFLVNATGPDGSWFHVDFSSDLVSWTSICTNQVVNGAICVLDADAPPTGARFYRVVPESAPPQ